MKRKCTTRVLDVEWNTSVDWNTFVLQQFRRLGAGSFKDFRFVDDEHNAVRLKYSENGESSTLNIRHRILDRGLYVFRFSEPFPDEDRFSWWYFYIATNSNFHCEYFGPALFTPEIKQDILKHYQGVKQEITKRQKDVCDIISEFWLRDICKLIAQYEHDVLVLSEHGPEKIIYLDAAAVCESS